MANEDSFYVGIKQPTATRRSILETSREVLHNLQLYEEIKDLKVKRSKLQDILLDEVENLKSLMKDLKRNLPNLSKTKPEKKVKVKSSKEIDTLEKELSAVEKELGSMK